MAENRHFPRNVVLMFHCGSEKSFENCEAFYRMLPKHRTQYNFLWIANTDCSFGGTSGWRERIARLVNKPEPRFLLTSLEKPDPDLRNIISSFFSDILENNQLTTDKCFLDDQVSPYSEYFKGSWINGVQTIESCTQWQTGGDRLIKTPQVQSWIGGRDDMEEKPQGFAAMRRSASWSDWPWDTIQGEASIDRESLQGLNSGKSDDEDGEIAVQSDCIPSTTLGKGHGAEEKSTNTEGLSILYEMSTSNKKSGWYPEDEEEAWVEWTAYLGTSVQWLRHFCFGCVGRR
ncbi:hypothetical protein CJF32_00007232 [Rutstroemia sp. NJR-2017a WRK4]|nr:hypothetical protein CJF32_00007232 [Rutstroemia sp. NJR-2017a WRK4]